MAFPAAISWVFFLLLVAFTARAGAATFTITNRCSFVVCPGAIPIGGGTQLSQGQTWTLQVPAGTSSTRIWGRTSCSFSSDGRGSCQTGDCEGELSCKLSGKPPTTLAEITLGQGGDLDNYGISVVDGFNVPMDLSCSTGSAALQCTDSSCPDANHRSDEGKYHTCKGNSDYQVVFCP